jgi:aminomethyltransferase
VESEDALARLNRLLTNDLDRLEPGGVQYTLLCDDSGGVVDDMLVTLLDPGRAMIVPNAANTDAVSAAVRDTVGAEHVRDVSGSTAIIAVQGPASRSVVEQVGLPAGQDYMTFRPGTFDGADVIVSRSGYTGEHGYEVILPDSHALDLWEELLRARESAPCGLGARDTLRTEMGYPLHGQDIGPDIGPVAALLSWAVGWHKPEFAGREALMAQRAAPDLPRLRGLLVVDRGVPRAGMAVSAGGREVGRVTSGTFSPTLRQGIALALLDRELKPGNTVAIRVRDRDVAATVVKPPFVASSPK